MTERNIKLKVGKLDAARRQLGVAIELWFSDGDPVSIHTLTSAAHRVISDLLRARGGEDPFIKKIKPQHRREAIEKINAPSNFFKHADEDPDEALEFKPVVNGYKLVHCILMLGELGEWMNHLENAFFIRFCLENPEVVRDGEFENLAGGRENALRFAALPRPRFLRAMMAGLAMKEADVTLAGGDS